MENWIFQSNPTIYGLREALLEVHQHGNVMTWRTTKHAKNIHPGDIVYMWVSGADGGIVAVGTTITEPDGAIEDAEWEHRFYVPSAKARTNVKRVRVHVARMLREAVGRNTIRETASLGELLIFHMPQATNYPLTPAEAAEIEGLLDSVPQLSPSQFATDGGRAEGSVRTVLHQHRERDGLLPRQKKEAALAKTGKLACMVCGFDFQVRYGDHGRGYMECHHKVPLARLSPGQKTRLSDLELVCANCHRMLHFRDRDEPLPLEELRLMVRTSGLPR